MCFSVQFAVAQDDNEEKITISVSMFDKLRSDAQNWNDSTNVLLDSCSKLNSEISILRETITSLNGEIENNQNLSKIITKKDSLINALKDQHEADSSSIVNVHMQLDSVIARYANGRLYFKYDSVRIDICLNEFESIKTPSVKERFSQVPNLLKNYGDYSSQLKLLLQTAQDDPDRRAKNKADEYRKKYSDLIYNSFYYSNYYAKKNSGTWSIPYLNNVIEVALSILKAHNPGKYDYVNFNPLIEML